MIEMNRTDRSLLANWWWTVDRWSVAAFLTLIAVGLVMSFAASPSMALRNDFPVFHYVNRNLLYLIPAMAILFGVSLLKPSQIQKAGFALFAVGVALLILTMFIGIEVKGAQRWLRFGSFSLQPSEFVKPAFVIVIAWLFAQRNLREKFPGNLLAVTALVLIAGLLILQPDFGQVMLLTLIWSAMFFMSGVNLTWIFVLGALGSAGIFAAYTYMPHVANRINTFLDPASGDNYQVDKALEAIRAGGLVGVGPGEGIVKSRIPDAHTDFIFAVTAEEFGLVACLFIVVVFGVVVLRGLDRAMTERDPFVQMAASGLVVLFGGQTLINLGVNLQLLPAKGMTLPFVSYGGSSLLATALTVGMILALTRKRPSMLNS